MTHYAIYTYAHASEVLSHIENKLNIECILTRPGYTAPSGHICRLGELIVSIPDNIDTTRFFRVFPNYRRL